MAVAPILVQVCLLHLRVVCVFVNVLCFHGNPAGKVIIGERAKRARHYQGCTNSS